MIPYLKLKTFKKLTIYFLLFPLMFLTISYLTNIILHRLNNPAAKNEELGISFSQCENVPLDGEFMSSLRYKCYLESLKDSVKLHGLAKTSHAFDEYINNTEQAEIRGACHSWAHELGESAVRNGSSGVEIINSCVRTCLDGCFNGAGHAYVAKNPDLSDVNNFCSPQGVEVDHKKKDTCFHGIGHGIVDIFGTEIEKVIGYCNSIVDKEGKAQCSHAIFMLFNSIPESRVDLSGIPENMSNFCKNLNSVYQSYCYDFSGYLTYGKTKNTKKAFMNCRGVPVKNRTECFRRIGDIFYLFNPKMEPKSLAKQCTGTTIEEVLWCALGIGKLLIADGNNLPERSFEVCSSFSGEIELTCYKELGESLEYLQSKKDRERICGLLDKPLSNGCLGI